MLETTADSALQRQARIAGLLYLFVFVAGPLADFYLRAGMIVHDDPAATARHILAAEPLYRLSIALDLLTTAAYTGVTAMLYTLLKPAGRSLATVAAFVSLVALSVSAAATVNQLAPLTWLNGPSPFSPAEAQSLAYNALRLYGQGLNLALLFFGFYCFFIGWLILRARFLPNAVGVLMVIAGIAWLFVGFSTVLWPAFARGLSPYDLLPGIVGEASLTLWLIIRGVDAGQWRAQAGAAA